MGSSKWLLSLCSIPLIAGCETNSRSAARVTSFGKQRVKRDEEIEIEARQRVVDVRH